MTLSEIQCRFCHNAVAARELDSAYDAFQISDLPPSWIVFDGYPPGDDGLHFACSEACFVAWKTDRDRRYQ